MCVCVGVNIKIHTLELLLFKFCFFSGEMGKEEAKEKFVKQLVEIVPDFQAFITQKSGKLFGYLQFLNSLHDQEIRSIFHGSVCWLQSKKKPDPD